MKYVSLDLETTCFVPDPHHILMVSMVVEDTKNIKPLEELPHLTFFVDNGTLITGSPFALQMNAWILKILADKHGESRYPIHVKYVWPGVVLEFLNRHFGKSRIVAAGKNVAGFDLQFLPIEIKDRFVHRVLDPGSIFIDWETDEVPPDMKTCMRRAKILSEVTHDAYEDALDVINLLRTQYVK
jgi:oligoribonuclease (3'-5' exoribonuclease)